MHPGDTQETPGGTEEAPTRHPEGTQEAGRRHLNAPRGTQEAPRRSEASGTQKL